MMTVSLATPPASPTHEKEQSTSTADLTETSPPETPTSDAQTKKVDKSVLPRFEKALFDEIDIVLYFDSKGTVWYHADTIAKAAEYKSNPFNHYIKQYPTHVVGIRIPYEGIHELFVNEQELKFCFSKMRKAEQVKVLAEFLNIYQDQTIFFNFSPENEWTTKIARACHRFPSQTEYSVKLPGKTYRVDLYFPTAKLAIECDEHGHSQYPPEEERKREKDVRATIQCEFYRFNPHDLSRGIEYHIGEILHLLYDRTYDLQPKTTQKQTTTNKPS